MTMQALTQSHFKYGPSAVKGFMEGMLSKRVPRKEVLHAEKKLREDLSEAQIDKMVADSFPASDPPSTY